MSTLFSHIIQKQFSRQNEDVATEALAYILDSSETALQGLNRFLKGIVPNLPDLRFRTQVSESGIRPDMWGFDGAEPRVYIENKFWAGLTDNQPVSYITRLSRYRQPTLQLVIAPAARKHTLWSILLKRLDEAGIPYTEEKRGAGTVKRAETGSGTVLALASWIHILSILEHAVSDDPVTRADIAQLRGLCEAADSEAFLPVSGEELSDQRTPAFILQLGSVLQEAVDAAVAEGVIDITGVRIQSSWERFGRYVYIPDTRKAGAWFGVHFDYWHSHGITPFWLIFDDGDFGRSREVIRLIEPWSVKSGAIVITDDRLCAIAINIPAGEEKETVVDYLVNQFREIAAVLESLPPKEHVQVLGDEVDEFSR